MEPMRAAPGTLQVWSDLGCPWSHAVVWRLHDARRRLGLDRARARSITTPFRSSCSTPSRRRGASARPSGPSPPALAPRAGWQRMVGARPRMAGDHAAADGGGAGREAPVASPRPRSSIAACGGPSGARAAASACATSSWRWPASVTASTSPSWRLRSTTVARGGRSSTTGRSPAARRSAARHTCSRRTARTPRTPGIEHRLDRDDGTGGGAATIEARRPDGYRRPPRPRGRRVTAPPCHRADAADLTKMAPSVPSSVHLPPFERLVDAHAAELHRFLVGLVGADRGRGLPPGDLHVSAPRLPTPPPRRQPARVAVHHRATQGDRCRSASRPSSDARSRRRRARRAGRTGSARSTTACGGTFARLPTKQRDGGGRIGSCSTSPIPRSGSAWASARRRPART